MASPHRTASALLVLSLVAPLLAFLPAPSPLPSPALLPPTRPALGPSPSALFGIPEEVASDPDSAGRLNKYSHVLTGSKQRGAAQAMLYATGIEEEQMSLPQIGVASCW